MDSFYFYDLETSGINPRNGRIMQFAGQRTDSELRLIGSKDNFLIKMTPDILPEPAAVLITGITPQATLSEGISEAEFLKYFYDKIALPKTIFVGFNNIRFDDEFIRYLNYRNLYDAYEWHWKDQRSRWDILDVSRMTRALRPNGINWPRLAGGKGTNRLELLASANKLHHNKAHDAESDVQATIDLARLIKDRQPRLFSYLLEMRDKIRVEQLVSRPEPFIYTSGRYNSDNEKTTVAFTILTHPTQKGCVLVYDLQTGPEKYMKLSKEKLIEKMFNYESAGDESTFPIKTLQFNRCPAVAPISVLDNSSQKRLGIKLERVYENIDKLLANTAFFERLKQAVIEGERKRQTSLVIDIKDVDSQLYDGFFGNDDKTKMKVVREANLSELTGMSPDFNDNRLYKLLLLYKARQYPLSLNLSEQKQWEEYRKNKLLSGKKSLLSQYFSRLQQLKEKPEIDKRQLFLLEELQLYGESLIPY